MLDRHSFAEELKNSIKIDCPLNTLNSVLSPQEIEEEFTHSFVSFSYDYLSQLQKESPQLAEIHYRQLRKKELRIICPDGGQSIGLANTPFIYSVEEVGLGNPKKTTANSSYKKFLKRIDFGKVLPYGLLFYRDPNQPNTIKERWGYYGNSLSNQAKLEILEKMESSESKVILWAYNETLEVAKAKQITLQKEGIGAEVILVPESYQAEIKELYKIVDLPWYKSLQKRAHLHYSKWKHPIKTLTRALRIARSQYVEPSKEDTMAALRMLATMLIVKTWVYKYSDMSYEVLTRITLLESGLTILLTTYIKTLDNLFKASYFYDFVSGRGEFFKRMTFYSLPLTELWRYVVGPGLENTAPITTAKGQVEILEQVIIGGSTSALYNTSRNTYLSPDAIQRIYWYMAIPGTALSAMNMAGLKWFAIPIGLIEITAPLVSMTALYIGIAYAIKKNPQVFEKLGRHGLYKVFKNYAIPQMKEKWRNSKMVQSCKNSFRK